MLGLGYSFGFRVRVRVNVQVNVRVRVRVTVGIRPEVRNGFRLGLGSICRPRHAQPHGQSD